MFVRRLCLQGERQSELKTGPKCSSFLLSRGAQHDLNCSLKRSINYGRSGFKKPDSEHITCQPANNASIAKF